MAALIQKFGALFLGAHENVRRFDGRHEEACDRLPWGFLCLPRRKLGGGLSVTPARMRQIVGRSATMRRFVGC